MKDTKKIRSKDTVKNFNYWGKSSGNNILWITGFSGSGKTYLANFIAKNDEHIVVISLDDFCEVNENYIINLKEKYSWLFERIYDEIIAIEKSKNIKEYLLNINNLILKIKMCSIQDYNLRKYIIEGIQIYDFIPYTIVKGGPIIIKRSSFIKCAIHRLLRIKTKEHISKRSIKENIMAIKEYYNWYKSANKQINNFLKLTKYFY